MDPNTEIPQIRNYFICCLTAYYQRDKTSGLKERTFNVIMDTDTPHLSKEHLAHIQQQGMQRINAENGVEPEMVQDMVIVSINMLGCMPAEQFDPASVVPETKN